MALTIWTFVDKVMPLLFNTLSMLVIALLPRSNHLLISGLQSPSAAIFKAQKEGICLCFHLFPFFFCHEVMGPDAMILVFLILSFKLTFSLSSFILIKKLFSSSFLSAIKVVSYAYMRLLIFLLAILILFCNSSSLVLVENACSTIVGKGFCWVLLVNKIVQYFYLLIFCLVALSIIETEA